MPLYDSSIAFLTTTTLELFGTHCVNGTVGLEKQKSAFLEVLTLIVLSFVMGQLTTVT
jgi:hypothetical protein